MRCSCVWGQSPDGDEIAFSAQQRIIRQKEYGWYAAAERTGAWQSGKRLRDVGGRVVQRDTAIEESGKGHETLAGRSILDGGFH